MLSDAGLGLSPGPREMLLGWHALEILDAIVMSVPVAVMDVAAARDGTKGPSPHVAVKPRLAFEIAVRRWPDAIDAAIENLRKRVNDDWIDEPVCRSLADFHPSTVRNK